MTWEISISSESWNLIYGACHQLAIDDPNRVIVALMANECAKCKHEDNEDTTADYECGGDLCLEYWNAGIDRLSALPPDVLGDMLYEGIEEHRNCSDGGHEIYLDRDGFDRLDWDDIERMAKEYFGEE